MSKVKSNAFGWCPSKMSSQLRWARDSLALLVVHNKCLVWSEMGLGTRVLGVFGV